jgi:hypothetical protein
MSMHGPGMELQLRHRHDDGSWATMDSEPIGHDAARHDPERDWTRWRLFRCRTCNEVLTVHQGEIDVPGMDTGRH